MATRGTSLTDLSRAMPGVAASKRALSRARFRWLVAMLAAFAAIGVAAPTHAQTSNQGASALRGLQKPDFTHRGQNQQLGNMLQFPKVASSEPMLLQADEMVYDNDKNLVTARGNVEIYYGNYTLLAEQVVYDRNANTLTAIGNVRIKDPEGAVITSDHMTLTDDFRDGFIDALRLVTKDDTRIVAENATREAGNVTVFQNGWFTPCKPCADNPEAPPTWRIRATKIIHKKDEATLTYRNAIFDLDGIPVFYLPYFQSADPTVKRKSGFLMPTGGHSDQLGTTVSTPYYFALSDNYDFIFDPEYTESAGYLMQGFWRQRTANGGYDLNLAGVFDKGTLEDPTDGDFRGSLTSKGKFALDPYFSWGWDITELTDPTFRRFYNLDTKIQTDQVSQLYLEGLEDRNYFAMRFYQANNLTSDAQPDADVWVLPSIDYDYIFKNPILGGELSINSNVMDLVSDDDGPDSARAVTEVNWRRQMIDGAGEVFTPFAQARGELYDVNNFIGNPKAVIPTASAFPSIYDVNSVVIDPKTGENNGTQLLGDAIGGIQYRYPFVGTTGPITHIIEPIAQIVAAPNSLGNQALIPNEDAKSLVFDDTTLFEIDKFSGYDRMQTGTRADVGFRYTAQLPSGAYAQIVAGQSYQIAGTNPFAPETGLGSSNSDYVTGLYLEATQNLTFSAQTRFDHETLDLERTDIGTWSKYGPLELSINYADVTFTPGFYPNQPSEEILSTGALALTEDWSLIGNVRYDLENSRPIADGVGVRYQDDCFMLAFTYEKTYIQDQDIKPDDLFLVNIALKYLGTYGFETSAFSDNTTSSGALE